jgi:dipeptidase E
MRRLLLTLYHLKKSGADKVLNEMIDNGKVVVGLSAGSIALGPDNTMCNYIYPEDNIFKVTDLSALDAVNIRIYPHFKEHYGVNPDIENKLSEFESKYNCEVTRLNNNQAILVIDDKLEKIG